MFALLGSGWTARHLVAAVGWLLGPVMLRDGAPDMCATIEAKGVFDLTSRLSSIRAPTLVVGGDRDAPYGPGIFRKTARGLPNGRLLLYQGTGRAGVQSKRRFVRDVLEFLGSGPGQRITDSRQGKPVRCDFGPAGQGR